MPYRHGHGGKPNSPTYTSWLCMKRRKAHPGEKDGPNYADVSICERWMVFENFLEDMGERPSGTTLDRFPNPRGNYEPGNCRWATNEDQQNNKTNNVRVSYGGKTQTIGQWAKEIGVRRQILTTRIQKLGWSAERALTTPVKKYKTEKF